ncbi:glycerate dehydrogenase [bacterium BMS3Bbin10]|nr:glycerate dehydrogenase [bacterium BMS3Bbin10]
MKRVLVTEPLHESGMALLEARPDIEIAIARDITPETLAKAVRDVHGIAVRVARLPAEVLSCAGKLEVVSRHGVGCDRLDMAHLNGRGIPVMIAAGASAATVAEHAMGLLLATARGLVRQDRAIRDGWFNDRLERLAVDLSGATMLIVGFGRIGRKLAPLARAFGMEVIVADIALDAALAREMGCRGVADFRPELPKADMVSLHVPLDETTRDFISGDEFAAMKDGAILINCARGAVVNEAAMIAALDSGKLAGAGLDVFAAEPAPDNHPLFSRTDVVLSPHTAASSGKATKLSSEMTARNILDFFDGAPRQDCIFNPEVLGP